MKFEHLLQLYWSRGFLFGNQLIFFKNLTATAFNQWAGIAHTFQRRLIRRFELTEYNQIYSLRLPTILDDERQNINTYLSTTMSVNSRYNDWLRLHLLRLYLNRSYRGRCHMVGKPVRGQRTWSNAWTAYCVNTKLRTLLNKLIPNRRAGRPKLPKLAKRSHSTKALPHPNPFRRLHATKVAWF